MILKGAEIARYLARPDPTRPALLIFGADAMRVALKRAEAVAALTGPDAEAEMRLTRLPSSTLRKSAADLTDAMRATGFFPGPRVVLVEDTPDTAADAVRAALTDWRPGDATLVVTAGALGKASPLRKLFDAHPTAVAAPIYDDPPGEEEITRWLTQAGVTDITPAARRDLMALARALPPGDLRQTIDKIGLYKHGDPAPLTPEDIEAMAPATLEAGIDDLLHATAEGRTADVAQLFTRLTAQGITPVTLTIAASRHFRALHAAACDPGGPVAGLSRMRPPVFGPRRDRMARQAQSWGMARAEEALRHLTDTDLTLRSAARAPQAALVERTLIRLAALAAGR